MNSTVFLDERQVITQPFETHSVPTAPSFFSDLVRAVFPRVPERSGHTVLLTAPHRGCGVSFAASCIVAELASFNGTVLLVDALTLSIIDDAKRAPLYCERIGSGRVWVLGHQQIARGKAGSHGDLASPVAVLEALQQEFSYIVIDAPALSAGNLPLLLSTSVAGVVLVARAGLTEAKAVTSSCNRFISLGAHVFGSVFNAR